MAEVDLTDARPWLADGVRAEIEADPDFFGDTISLFVGIRLTAEIPFADPAFWHRFWDGADAAGLAFCDQLAAEFTACAELDPWPYGTGVDDLQARFTAALRSRFTEVGGHPRG